MRRLWYSCENGNDGMIEAFDTATAAIVFAESHLEVKEIFEFENVDDDNCEILGCIWKRSE